MPDTTFVADALKALEEVAAVVRTSYGPFGRLKGTVDDLGQVTFTARGAAILTRLRTAHPVGVLLRTAARGLEFRAGDGTTAFLLLLTGLMREVLRQAPQANEVLRRRHLTAAAHALARLPMTTLPDVLGPALKAMAQWVSGADEPGASMPPWREATMLLLHSHLCTGLTRHLATALTHLVCELVMHTMDALRPRPRLWCAALACLAPSPPVVSVAGGSLDSSDVIDGLLLDTAPMSPHMVRQIPDPHGVLVLSAPLMSCLMGPDGKPIDDSDTRLAADARFNADPQAVLGSLERYAVALTDRLIAQDVRLVLSTHRLPETFAGAWARRGGIAAQCVGKEEVRRVCAAAGTHPLADLPSAGELRAGWTVPSLHVASATATGMFLDRWLRVTLLRPRGCGHTLVLRCPAPLLCDEYRTVTERALRFLNAAAAAAPTGTGERDGDGDPTDSEGVWILGGAGAPFLRCAVALEDPPEADSHPRHPDAAAAHRGAVWALREGMLDVVRALALPLPRAAARDATDRLLAAHRAHAACTAGLVATLSTPALIAFADVAATEEAPVTLTAALQPLDALTFGVYDSLRTFELLVAAAVEAAAQLLRIDGMAPAAARLTDPPAADSDSDD